MSSRAQEKIATGKPHLLYLTIESVIDSVTGNPVMKIIQQQLVNGRLRTNDEVQLKNGNWQISLLNAKGKRIDSVIINDPHIQDMEFMNEKGEFEMRKIRFIRIEIPLRFNYSSSIKEMEIMELTEDRKNKHYFRTTLIL